MTMYGERWQDNIQKYPDEGILCGMNLLAEIIRNVKSEVEESHREKQITIEEWIALLQGEDRKENVVFAEVERGKGI
ncbi:MAG: hypothetical protein HFG68_14410 [Hungatella sp.]|nr:hypothetical protein [Hungatella sp.]